MAKIININQKKKASSEDEREKPLKEFSRHSPEELQMTVDSLEDLAAMSEDDRNLMLELIDKIDAMPEKEKKKLAKAFDDLIDQMEAHTEFMDSILGLEDEDFDDEEFDEEDDDFDEEEDESVYDYPHFIPQRSVERYTLRVTLRGIKPPIYRKFVVPSNITLRHLSELIIELMGWEGSHLNQFHKGNSYSRPAHQLFGDEYDCYGDRYCSQEKLMLSDILRSKGSTIEWEYDFGDSWYHDIRLSSTGQYKEGEALVSFVKGERHCPPEDCGGIWGYQELLTLHKKRQSRKRLTAEEKDRLEWYDITDDYDPEHFDTELAKNICQEFCE